MLLLAAQEAWQQSGWEPAENLPLVLGTTGGGMLFASEGTMFRRALQPTLPRIAVRPFVPSAISRQMQARLIMDALNFNGPITVVSNACASGANAIGQAWELIHSGQAERVTGRWLRFRQRNGCFSGFDSLQALSPTVCRPFDARRDGLCLGEGADQSLPSKHLKAQKNAAQSFWENSSVMPLPLIMASSYATPSAGQYHASRDEIGLRFRSALRRMKSSPLYQCPRHRHFAQRQFGSHRH